MPEQHSREGPVRAILFSEFHPVAGPKITFQFPDNYVTKDTFDAISVYIIPKPELQYCTLSLNILGYKILGFPCKIEHQKYTRNALQFNLCFVFDSWSKTSQYELTVQKFAEYLATYRFVSHYRGKADFLEQFLFKVTLEKEKGFISNPATCATLPKILEKVLQDMNTNRCCTIETELWRLHLKVARLAPDPPPVEDYHVPILTDEKLLRYEQWDLTTQQVLPHINGTNHVTKTAALADVATGLVKACIQNLIYYGAARLQPLFLYSNVYAATPNLRLLLEDVILKKECLETVTKSESSLPNFRDVFTFFSELTYGSSLKDICQRLNPHNLKIDEQRLVQFGVSKGLIRRVHKFPVYENATRPPDALQRLFNGINSLDAIACRTGKSYQELDEKIEQDPDVVVIWK